MSTEPSLIFYVYVYLDPRVSGRWEFRDHVFEYQPFYVGCGKGPRMKAHLRPSQLAFKNRKAHKMRSIIADGFTPLSRKIYEGLAREEVLKIEQEMIRHFGRLDNETGMLCNHTDGGDGMLNHRHTTEQKARLVISSHRAQKTLGRYRCVFKSKGGKYTCGAKVNGSLINRTYPTEIEAAAAYDRLALYQYGPDAIINLPERRPEYLAEDLKAFRDHYLTNSFFTLRRYGTQYNKAARRWRTCILLRGRYLYLGMYDTEERAAEISDMAIVHLGIDHSLNYPDKLEWYQSIPPMVVYDSHLSTSSLALEQLFNRCLAKAA